MKWHLQPKVARDAIVDALEIRKLRLRSDEWGNSQSEATDAAIALLESAAPYGDDELVYEYKSETLWLWHIGGDLWNPWAIHLVGEHRDAIQLLPSNPLLTPLTPAAASLLAALRGE